MSKVSFSRELLGTIRFIFDKTKSRTLNATQAYDISTSQIVLGSFPASATKKLLTKDLGSVGPDASGRAGAVAVNYVTWGSLITGTGLGKAAPAIAAPTSANVSWTLGMGASNSTRVFNNADIVLFSGSSAGISVLPGSTDNKSNATKDIFYGAITVGTGLYREWQGKYAVLKVDLLTNNAILRVYNE